MKTLRITLDDDEYERLREVKGDRTWKELLLSISNNPSKLSKVNELYVRVAEVLLELSSLHGDKFERKSLRRAALVPLFVAGKSLAEEEKTEAGLASLAVLEELIEGKTSDLEVLNEVKWIIQALRMLLLGQFKVYELSLNNLIELRRKRPSSD